MEKFSDILLLGIENRGKHATGFVAVNTNGKVVLDKAAKPASEFIKEREKLPEDTRTILLHTRFWTQGSPTIHGNNHPVIYKTCFVVHNGGIWNDDLLFDEENVKRNYQVDSEIIPALLYKSGLNDPAKIKSCLEKFEGDMAIAAIDPIESPGRVILARGNNSPLYVFENKNVVVWASAYEAIKEAWGSIIGTPPSKDKVEQVKEGKFLILDGESVERLDFTPPSTWGHSWNQRNTRGGSQHTVRRLPRRGLHPTYRPWDADGPFKNYKEFLDAHRRLRAESKLKARLYPDRDSYTFEDLQDEKGVIRWVQCICTHSVLAQDMTNHIKYGDVCIDCYDIIREKWLENSRNKVEELESGGQLHEIPERDKSNLENWAKIESQIHRTALIRLEKATGYTRQALDFLLFRAGEGVADFGIGMRTLKADLIRLYDQELAEVHTNWASGIMEDIHSRTNSAQEAQEVADEAGQPWISFSQTEGAGDPQIMYVCTEHGEIFPATDYCASCEIEEANFACETNSCTVADLEEYRAARQEAPKALTAGDLNDTKTCATCGMVRHAELPCQYCIAQALTQKAEQIQAKEKKPFEEPATEHCCGKTSRGKPCGRKVVRIVESEWLKEPIRFCERHWKACSANGCKEKRVANFTTHAGERVCHVHSRNRQGETDTSAEQRGIISLVVK